MYITIQYIRYNSGHLSIYIAISVRLSSLKIFLASYSLADNSVCRHILT